MTTAEIFFPSIPEELSELLIAELSNIDYETFWQDDDGLRAYINYEKFNEELLQSIVVKYAKNRSIDFKIQFAKPNQWDRVKSDCFEPIVIGNEITIRSRTESKKSSTAYELILDAQMAFGAGNHPSTALCLEAMLDIDFQDKDVVDVGTGSGILAVLSEKLGAKSICAFDNNPWAVEVAAETLKLNKCGKIKILEGEIEGQLSRNINYDVVLANLNFDVLKATYTYLPHFVKENGCVLVSGFMVKDEKTLLSLMEKVNLTVVNRLQQENWIAILLKRYQ